MQPIADGEAVLPLSVRTRRIDRRHGVARGFEAVGIADERDDPVALGDVFLQALDERTRPLLEILLHAHLAADGAQVAGQRVAAGLELARDGGKKDFHV